MNNNLLQPGSWEIALGLLENMLRSWHQIYCFSIIRQKTTFVDLAQCMKFYQKTFKQENDVGDLGAQASDIICHFTLFSSFRSNFCGLVLLQLKVKYFAEELVLLSVIQIIATSEPEPCHAALASWQRTCSVLEEKKTLEWSCMQILFSTAWRIVLLSPPYRSPTL